MRPVGIVLVLGLCLGLWVWGLLLGRPWPITIAVLAPGRAQEAFFPQRAPDPRPPLSEGLVVPPRPTTARLTPRAGAPQLTHALACAPQELTLEVHDAFGRRRGLEQLAVGWPAREGGYGVLAPDPGRTTFSLHGRGLRAPAQLTLTSLGGVFDGSGTLEITAKCEMN